MSDRAARWRAGRPGHGREPRTRPQPPLVRSVEAEIAETGIDPRLFVTCEGYYPEVHVDDDPDVDAAVERRAALDELVRLSKQHGLYPDDDGWEDQ